MTGALLRVCDLDVVYRVGGVDLKALQEVSFDIERGEIVGLVGESGSGKSTVAAALLKILAANGRIAGGSIEFDGVDLASLSGERMRRVRGADIAMIFQDPLGSLNPTVTVGRQLMQVAASHPERAPGSAPERRRRAVELFAEVGIPDPERRLDHYPHQFSGGMRQRVMIAMALMLQPKLIVADEATSALDVTLQAQILDLFREVRDRYGTSMLLVSHDLGVVAQTCERVAVMYAGRIVESAGAQQLFRAPAHPYTRALLATAPSYEDRQRMLRGIPGRVPGLHEVPDGCSYADRCPHRRDDCSAAIPVLEVAAGHEVRCVMHAPGAEPPGPSPAATGPVAHTDRDAERIDRDVVADSSRPLLVARAVTKHFDVRRSLWDRIRGVERRPVQAVDHVDLELRRGEILGLVGESGSGKTTLAMTLMRLTEASSGSIEVDGADLRSLDRGGLRRLRSRMQIVLQDPVGSLSPRMRVRDVLAEPYVINHRAIPEGRVAELLELVGLSAELADKYPKQLSGGQARRVSIARALALEPALIVADEPTSGLDVSAAAGVLALMNDLRERLDVSYLIITHDLNVVGQIADRIAVMYLGQVIESGTTAQIFENPVHPYTQGLLAAVPRIHDLGRSATGVPRGEMPSPQDPPAGCRFHTRCPLAVHTCSLTAPVVDTVQEHHTVACHLWPEALRGRLDAVQVVPVAATSPPHAIQQRGRV